MDKTYKMVLLILILVSVSFAKRRKHLTDRFAEQKELLNSDTNPIAPYTHFLDSFLWERDDDSNHSPTHQQNTRYTVKTKVSLTESEVEEPEEPTAPDLHLEDISASKEHSMERYSEYEPSKFREYKTNSYRPIKHAHPHLSTTTRKYNNLPVISASVPKPVQVVTRLPLLQLAKDLSYTPPKSVQYNTSQTSIQLPSINSFTSHLPKTEYQISIIHAPPEGQSYAIAKTNSPPFVTYQTITTTNPTTVGTSETTTRIPKTKLTTVRTMSRKPVETTTKTVIRQTETILINQNSNEHVVNEDELEHMDLQPLAAPKGNFGARIKSKN